MTTKQEAVAKAIKGKVHKIVDVAHSEMASLYDIDVACEDIAAAALSAIEPELREMRARIGELEFALDEAERACKAEAQRNAGARLTAGVRAGSRDVGKFARARMAIRCANHIRRARAALSANTQGGAEDGA